MLTNLTPLRLLKLGRASNLPTVWTNSAVVLVTVGGATVFHDRPALELVLLLLAGSLLYLAGCTWNDAKDAAWDAQHRPERPIPAGLLTARSVWWTGNAEAAAGLGLLAYLGWLPLASGVLTLAAIGLYTWIHKQTPKAVLAMAWCRLQWAVTVALTCGGGWAGLVAPENARFWVYLLALAASILLISLVARGEATRGGTPTATATAPPNKRPLLPQLSIANQAAVAVVVISGNWTCYSQICLNHGQGAWWAVLIAAGWLVYFLWSLKTLRRAGRPGIGSYVARSLAALCLLDAAFLASVAAPLAPVALLAWGLAWLLQKWVPAT